MTNPVCQDPTKRTNLRSKARLLETGKHELEADTMIHTWNIDTYPGIRGIHKQTRVQIRVTYFDRPSKQGKGYTLVRFTNIEL